MEIPWIVLKNLPVPDRIYFKSRQIYDITITFQGNDYNFGLSIVSDVLYWRLIPVQDIKNEST